MTRMLLPWLPGTRLPGHQGGLTHVCTAILHLHYFGSRQCKLELQIFCAALLLIFLTPDVLFFTSSSFSSPPSPQYLLLFGPSTSFSISCLFLLHLRVVREVLGRGEGGVRDVLGGVRDVLGGVREVLGRC